MGLAKKLLLIMTGVVLAFGIQPTMNASAETYTRIGGTTRYSTAVAIADELTTGTVKNVVLTTGDSFADALSAAPLASSLNAPILLSSSTPETSSDAINYINSNTDNNSTTYIIGGDASVPESISNTLKTKVIRISGADRYETNLKIAEAMNVPKGTPIFIASGESYPDALSIAGIAAHSEDPIILIGPQGITPELNNFITQDSPTNIYFIGGPAVLSLEVQQALAHELSNTSILRLAGSDRYETTEAVNNAFIAKPTSKVYVTTGSDFADALAASSLTARDQAPLIYEDPLRLGAPLAMDKYLNAVYSSGGNPSVVALGGESASPDCTVSEIKSTLAGTIPSTLSQYNSIGDKDFVKLSDFVPYAMFDIRYMTTNNFTSTQLYPSTYIPTVRKDMAIRLAVVASDLYQKGYRMTFWDAYRPSSAQQLMWNFRPDANYIANPSGWGSNHEHGGAVDVTLSDFSGNEIQMPTDFDDATTQAGRTYSQCRADEKTNALILQNAMQAQGFVGLSTEWWHYDDEDVANDPKVDNATPTCLPAPAFIPPPVDTTSTITISATGDNTLANGYGYSYSGSFNEAYANNGANYFYQNVHDTLSKADLSLGNLEGVLTTATNKVDKSAQGSNAFWFKGRPEYAETLIKAAPYDAVDLANNHSDDYLSTGFYDTVDALTSAGVGYFGYGHMYTTTRKGIKIAVLGYNVIGETEQYIDPGDNTKLVDGREDKIINDVRTDVAAAKSQGNQIVIVFYHWGTECNTGVDDYQTVIGHATVDAGANLVLGAHPHVIEPTEIYNGVPIVYSLGNFVFGGNYNEYDYTTEISQVSFNFVNGALKSTTSKSIPCLSSTSSNYNNFQPEIVN